VFDPATGNSELLAEIKDSIGELHPPNQIFYRDAFDGILADLRYSYRKGGFVQDVVIRERVSLPAGYGPDSRLEVWTEFLEAPVPVKRERMRAGMADEGLDFGTMEMSAGKAFALGEAEEKGAPVSKRWLTIDQRTFLVEAVQFGAVAAELNLLPAPRQQAAVRQPKAQQMARADVNRRPFPAPRQAKAKDPKAKIQMAGLPPADRGLVLDYDLSGTITNLILKGDSTYYVSGIVTLRNPTFEGGVVIKMANTNGARIFIADPSGGFTWRASAYRPVVITARDDHTVGAKIGTNALSGYYANSGLRFGSGAAVTLEHLRVSHAVVGVSVDESDLTNRHSQFVHCGDGIEGHYCYVTLESVLFNDVTNVLSGEWTEGAHGIKGTHLTVNKATRFCSFEDVNCDVTNSICVNMGDWGCGFNTNAVVRSTNDNTFQTVGAGAHYLAANSPYRNAGVTNLSVRLLADLKTLTTYPPIVIVPGALTNSLTLYPQAQRDTDLPDLGYHYCPIDYAFGHVWVTDATIAVNPGVVIGTYVTNDNCYGLAMFNNSTLAMEGTPANLVHVVRHNTAQEQANTNWGARMWECTASAGGAQTIAPQMRFRFVDWSVLAQECHHFHGYYENDFTANFRDCQFHGGMFITDWPALAVTNCLFERVFVDLNQLDNGFNVAFHDNTFFGGALNIYQEYGGTWTFKDNLFDQTGITNASLLSVTHDYNAYVTNSYVTNNYRIGSAAEPHDKMLTNAPVYLASWLGRYYYPTNDGMLSTLLNAGSTAANNLGLYHFTTTTNQVKETNSTVDIGFHYVAVNSAGQPIDTDGDSLADYFEDTDGDGTVDSGEASWSSSDTDGDGVSDYVEWLLGRNPLDADVDEDTGSVLHLRVYTPLR
jgi:hypothetical protein